MNMLAAVAQPIPAAPPLMLQVERRPRALTLASATTPPHRGARRVIAGAGPFL
jgi:hypothetical protein